MQPLLSDVHSQVVFLSIVFHDIIYNPRSPSNEEDSADLFKAFALEVSLSPSITGLFDCLLTKLT